MCGLPGFGRGLCFAGHYALVGLSKIRERHLLAGLAVQGRFPTLVCGVAVVDLQAGRHVATLEFTAGCHEVYDVAFLPGRLRPMLRTPTDADADMAVTAPDFGYFIP